MNIRIMTIHEFDYDGNNNDMINELHNIDEPKDSRYEL
jgi:hypothetical protein